LRLTPIFDTNIFGHVQDGSISQWDWRFLLARRPGHGWPLSSVTAVELLGGIREERPEKFGQQKEQIELAYQLSKGRIREDPRFLLCKEVLQVPFSLPRLRPELLEDFMTVVRRARSLDELLTSRVPVKKLQTKGEGHPGTTGFKPSVLNEVFAGPKSEWKERVEKQANDIYPRWREHFRETGQRLPDEMRNEVTSRLLSDAERMEDGESILQWLRAPADSESVAEIKKRLDAVLEFTVYVMREFLTRNHNLEKNESDVYDQFQLHYLALERFTIVSEDRNLRTRPARSSQTRRIMSFDEFLKSL
jgi:hypothetical protein